MKRLQDLFLKIDAWDKKSLNKIYFKAKEHGLAKWGRWISFAGDPRLWGIVGLVLGIYGYFVGDFTYVVLFVTSFFQSYLIYYIFKRTVKRARPFESVPGVIRMDTTGHGYGFPSGHSHHSAILIGMFWLVFYPKPWAIAILILYNIIIGFSRLITGCHFPSDVIFGILEAYLELLLYWLLTRPIYILIYSYFANLIFTQ